MSRDKKDKHRRLVLLRTDADPYIGAGHLMRCFSLAGAFRTAGWDCIFVMKEHSPEFMAMVTTHGFELIQVPSHVRFEKEAESLFQILANEPTAIVVDRYDLPADYIESWKVVWPSLTALHVDDLVQPLAGADIVLNQNLFATAELYVKSVPDSTILLAGASFALLRPEFLSQQPSPRKGEPVKHILVTLGGGNQMPSVVKIVSALRDGKIEQKITIITGLLAEADTDLRALEKKGQFQFVRAPENMAELMASADIAISGSGTTLFELAYLGVPTISLIVAENQVRNAEAADRDGIVILAGWAAAVEKSDLQLLIKNLINSPARRIQMSSQQQKLVDGRGAQRVVEALELSQLKRAKQTVR